MVLRSAWPKRRICTQRSRSVRYRPTPMMRTIAGTPQTKLLTAPLTFVMKSNIPYPSVFLCSREGAKRSSAVPDACLHKDESAAPWYHLTSPAPRGAGLCGSFDPGAVTGAPGASYSLPFQRAAPEWLRSCDRPPRTPRRLSVRRPAALVSIITQRFILT